jgi:carbamoyltransferase
MVRILGINETSHDAAVSVIEDGKIVFAAHAERYSKVKNDWFTNNEIFAEALSYGKPDKIAYYEDRWLKKWRIKSRGGLGGGVPFYKSVPELKGIPVYVAYHHHSHAAAGYYTSPFDDALVVVLDAIGEFTTSSIWVGEGEKLEQVKRWKYPFSFGLFYSAFTQLVGFKPNEEEYIFMGMAAYGDESVYYDKVSRYFPSMRKQKYNFHKGITDWGQDITPNDHFHIAAAVQKVYEERLSEFMYYARSMTGKKNLVFMGGCALNSKANTNLWNQFNNIWIMPNPGDAGSSLGAAAIVYGKHLDWQGPYLGTDLGADYPVDEIVDALIKDKIVAVASGRSEFGPRALGNRSIFADPRDPDIKDKVNKIKKREPFRPFAPVVMEEYASEWFDMFYSSPYMQYTPKCLQPDVIPSVVHRDGTSRVQTVNAEQHPGLYAVLKKFYDKTGVPVLLNTSLNIKGQPLINDNFDVAKWDSLNATKIVKSGKV